MTQEQTIHHHLAKSYIAYFVASLLGLLIDSFISVSFEVPYARVLAIIFFGLGPLLILWAQLTSTKFLNDHQIGAYFIRGPYRYLRNPTHVGILILVTGYTLVAGSLVFFGMTLVGFLVSNIFFTKYERQNERLFGDAYRSYQSQTPKLSMLYVIIADQKEARGDRIAEVLAAHGDSDVTTIDDSMMALADLEQFLYPSLFAVDVPVIHGKFLLSDADIDAAFAKQLAASPTVFIFEEFALPSPVATMLKKSGATVHVGEKRKKAATADDLFAATAAVTAPDKKARWLAYRSAVSKHPVEAILGILYWKLRTLAAKGPAGNGYETLYKDMLEAQAKAWKSGAPLEVLVEKVILSA